MPGNPSMLDCPKARKTRKFGSAVAACSRPKPGPTMRPGTPRLPRWRSGNLGDVSNGTSEALQAEAEAEHNTSRTVGCDLEGVSPRPASPVESSAAATNVPPQTVRIRRPRKAGRGSRADNPSRWSALQRSLCGMRTLRKLFGAIRNRATRRHTTKRADLLRNLEAPPGFEPGMEVLQISSGSLCC